MKIIKKKPFKICISLIIIAFIGYCLVGVLDKSNNSDNVLPSGLPDDEMIIVPSPPETDKKDNSLANKLLDRFGIISIEDEEVPLSGLSYNARDVGMIPNDKSKALHNANQLIRTLNVKGRIVIDDKYYITTPSESLTSSEIEITGMPDAEIIADNAYNIKLFDPALLKRITIKNVRFTNLDKANTFLIVYNDKKISNKVERVDVQGCTFSGNISLYRQYGNTDVDPDDTDFGIDEFKFMNNIVSNTKLSFIVLIDIPVRRCEIVGNSIRNFTYKFFNLSITNDAPYGYKLFDRSSYLRVENNSVVCDDDWWGETSSGLYYTFVLFEGDEVLYNNNHVEGMKTRSDFAVYDAYLSARVVNYTNNTWKNNICFAPGKTNNTLLKSKGGGSKPLIRNYTGNRFIVEEDYAERLGQSKENLYVYFMSLTQYAESYNINNNLFDVYDLRFPASSIQVGNFIFSENTVRAKKSSGNLAIVRTDDSYEVNSIIISNNTIDLGEKAEQTFNLIKMVNTSKDNKKSINKISVTNNSISAPLGYFLYEVYADNILFTGNKIKSTDNRYPGFAYGGRFIESNIFDNDIESRNSITFFEGRQRYGEGTKYEILNIARNNYVSGDNGMHLDLDYSSDTPTTYKRLYTFNTTEGTFEFYYTFTLSYNPVMKCAEVTFTDSKGETKTYRLGDTNKSTNGHGQFVGFIDTNGIKAGDLPFKVRFFNYKDSAGFYISEYNSAYSEIKIETVSYESDNIITNSGESHG